MSGPRRRSQRGIILIIVLWGVVLLALLAFALATAVRTGVEGIGSQGEQLQAHYFARGAIYQTIARLLAPPPAASDVSGAPSEPGPPRRLFSWQANGWQAGVRVESEAGRLDLNQAPPGMLARLFHALGLNEQEARTLADATEEWRSPDPNSALAVTEDAYYRGLPLPYAPPHADFQSVSEMLQVRGVTPDLYYGRYIADSDGRVTRLPGLQDCLTVHSGTSAIDINSAPYPVLLAAPGMDAQLAAYIVETRQRLSFASLEKLTEAYPGSIDAETLASLSAGEGARLRLLATATSASGVTAREEATIQLQPGKDPPFIVFEWNENYVR